MAIPNIQIEVKYTYGNPARTARDDIDHFETLDDITNLNLVLKNINKMWTQTSLKSNKYKLQVKRSIIHQKETLNLTLLKVDFHNIINIC